MEMADMEERDLLREDIALQRRLGHANAVFDAILGELERLWVLEDETDGAGL